MSVREYIGARYIPLFADPIEWDSSLSYEPLTVVKNQGSSYVSRQFVPEGVAITNENYWILWADFNAQLEQYRAEVQQFDGRITANADAIADEVLARQAADTALGGDISAEATARESADSAIEAKIAAVGAQFETFAALISAETLETGHIYATRGYAGAFDGGGALYAAVDVQDALTFNTAQLGVYVKYIPEAFVNAAAIGCVGETSAASIEKALLYSETYALPVVFPCDLSTNSTINIGNYPMRIDGNLTYNGANYAVELTDPPLSHNAVFEFNYIKAPSGNGVRIRQSNPDYTVTNPIIKGSRIEASNYGVVVQADTWGILEGEVSVGRIVSGNDGLRLICGQLDPDKTSFIGQMVFNLRHIKCSSGHAIEMNAPANSSITGCYFGPMSFENSSNGIRATGNGNIRMIEVESLRVFEADSFAKIIETSGRIIDWKINLQSPVRIDKVDVATTGFGYTVGVLITGGIVSPQSYKFADEMFVWSGGRTFRSNTRLGRNQAGNFIFGSEASRWRCLTEFRNTGSSNFEIRNLEYFSPFGIDRIYLNQNKTAGATYTLYDLNDNVIFDGSAVTETGRTTYEIRALYDEYANAVKYAVNAMPAGTPV